jgi:hypothetical protein
MEDKITSWNQEELIYHLEFIDETIVLFWQPRSDRYEPRFPRSILVRSDQLWPIGAGPEKLYTVRNFNCVENDPKGLATT